MKRGVGYCENPDCEDYSKGVFLLNHGDNFYCPRCRALGHTEPERGVYEGNAPFYSEVRVEYGFNAIEKRYCETAIVRDESLPNGNVYHFRTPLVKTENRALKMAESILSSLNIYGPGDLAEIPRTHETILSLDEPRDKFAVSCQRLHEQLENSLLSRRVENSAPLQQ